MRTSSRSALCLTLIPVDRFLIAALHVAALEECDTIASIKETIRGLPTDLKTLYEDTLKRISRMKPERSRIGLMALLWVTHAKRRLHIHELQQALGTRYTVGSFEVGRFDPDAVPDQAIILAASCGLLTVDASGEVYVIREFQPLFVLSFPVEYIL